MRLFTLLLGLLSLISHVHAKTNELVVGVQPYLSTRALITHHAGLVKHLGSALKRPVRIVTAKDMTTFGRRILAGDYDVAIGPGHFIRLAQLERGWHPLVRYAADTPLLLLAHKDAESLTLASLKGRTLATPGPSRLISVAAEKALASQGLVAGHDYVLLDADTVGNAVHAVVNGKTDMAVAALASLNQVRGSDLEQVRIVQEIATVPLLFFAAHPDMQPDMQAKLQRALLDYQTPQEVGTSLLGKQDLAAMDMYLDQTRRLLHHATPSSKQGKK